MSDATDNARRLALELATLLAFGAGAMDAITFSRLGDVFAGVMTGNIVLLGLSLGDGTAAVIGRVAVALVAFAAGVLAAGMMTRGSAPGVLWPRRVTTVLISETAVMLIFAVGWQLTAGRPAGTGQALLLAAAALAMGLQSGAVVTIGIAGLSTTYLTGTLTSLLTTAAHSSRIKTEALFIVGALLAGAAAAALAINNLPRLAPAVPLCAVAVVAGLALRAPQLGTDQD